MFVCKFLLGKIKDWLFKKSAVCKTHVRPIQNLVVIWIFLNVNSKYENKLAVLTNTCLMDFLRETELYFFASFFFLATFFFFWSNSRLRTTGSETSWVERAWVFRRKRTKSTELSRNSYHVSRISTGIPYTTWRPSTLEETQPAGSKLHQTGVR